MSEQASTDDAVKRLELWIGLIKFISGTVILGLVSAFLNHQYQTAQLDIEREKSSHAIELQDKQAEFKYLSDFMEHAINEDLEVRIRLANYMQSAALSENIKDIWREYHGLLVDQRKDAETRLQTLEEMVQELSLELAAMPPDNEARRQVSLNRIEDKRKEIFYLQDQIDRRKYGTFQETYVNVNSLLRDAASAYDAGQYQEALRLQRQALDGSSDYLRGYILNDISATYRAMRDFTNAERYARQAVMAIPDNPTTLYQLAITQKNDGQVDAAIETLRKAAPLAMGEQQLNIRLVIAGYLHHAGRRDEGMQAFEQIRAEVEANTEIATNLAWFRAVAGPRDEFYRALERALRLDTDNSTINWVRMEADLDRYRDDQRFKDIIAPYDVPVGG